MRQGRVYDSCSVQQGIVREKSVPIYSPGMMYTRTQSSRCMKQLTSSCSAVTTQHGMGTILCHTLQAKQETSGSQLCQRCICKDFLRMCNEW